MLKLEYLKQMKHIKVIVNHDKSTAAHRQKLFDLTLRSIALIIVLLKRACTRAESRLTTGN